MASESSTQEVQMSICLESFTFLADHRRLTSCSSLFLFLFLFPPFSLSNAHPQSFLYQLFIMTPRIPPSNGDDQWQWNGTGERDTTDVSLYINSVCQVYLVPIILDRCILDLELPIAIDMHNAIPFHNAFSIFDHWLT